jgi:ABC-2 type transport system ATP-binding protein
MDKNESYIIKTKGLTKTFISKIKGVKQEILAVKEIDLEVKKGEIFGFLGPNGAGKSTTQKMLSTLLSPTNGEALIAGYDLVKEQNLIRERIGYVSQAGGTDNYATGRENLIFQARIYGLDYATAQKNASEFIESFQMNSFIDRVASSYSGGQRRRLDVALGMVHHPHLLLLDEPTAGLDPQSRAYLWEEIKNLKNNGTTIFLTTHYMDEADKLCDTIAIIDHGKIIKQGTPLELKNEIGADSITFGFSNDETAQRAESLLKDAEPTVKIQKLNNFLHLYMKNGEKILPSLLRLFDSANLETKTITLSKPSLDDVFLKYTGRSLREDEK